MQHVTAPGHVDHGMRVNLESIRDGDRRQLKRGGLQKSV